MFLDSTIKRNPQLIEAAFAFHRTGALCADSYLLDYDAIMENGKAIMNRCGELGLSAYFMTKQLGRNPLISQGLTELGFEGAVVVDFRGAQVMMESGVPLGHVGHLVQPPKAMLPKMISYGVGCFTVYTTEKAAEIGAAAAALGKVQPILLRVCDVTSSFYEGQEGGFDLSELPQIAKEISAIPGIEIIGVTSFPTLLFDEAANKTVLTPNFDVAVRAANLLREMGYSITQVNTPSANCLESMALTAEKGGTHIEPGHALTGTTPFGAVNLTGEKPAIVYLTEVSHNFRGSGYCYGGGHYRRSHMANALVGSSLAESVRVGVTAPSDECIDYHFRLSAPQRVSAAVVMAFRTQIFTTRSSVAVIKGLSVGKPVIAGIYDSQGRLLPGGAI
ncbi:MAG: alanine racemase [Angelakisella sp.]